MAEAEIRALATRFFDAIEAGDVDAVAACYDPSVAIWHNDDGATQGRDENLKVLTGLVEHFSDRRYEDRRLDEYFDSAHVAAFTGRG